MCDFPAKVLLKIRRDVAVSADRTQDMETIRSQAAFVMAVDQLRIAHEELTNCRCWYEEIERQRSAA